MGRYLGWSSIGYSDEIWPDLGGKHRMVFFSGIIVVFLNGTITERRIILWQMASRKFSTMCHSFYSVTLHLERSIEFMLFSPLIGLEKILSSAIIQIRGMFHDKKGLHSRIQRTDIKGIPGGWECFACR